MRPIVVFGSLNMDLVLELERCPEQGETVLARSLQRNPGGKGANQAVACARMGAPVRMIGRVGQDADGELLLAALRADGIDATGVGVDADVPTGTAVVMVDASAGNRIVVAAGANAQVGETELQRLAAVLAQEQPMLLLQLEVPMPAVVAAARAARAAGCMVVLNPSPAAALPQALWPCVDVLVLNENEASALAGLGVHDAASARAAAQVLRARGPQQVIVTRGASGVIASDAAGGCIERPARTVEPVDTTAAGDTFTGAMCAALCAGLACPQAIERGIDAAAVCVTRRGAQASIPFLRELG